MRVSGLTLLLIWTGIITIGMAEAINSGSTNQYSLITYALLIGVPIVIYDYRRRQTKNQEIRHGV